MKNKSILNYTLSITFCMIGTLVNVQLAQAMRWNAANNPAKFDSNYEYRFNALPLKGMLPKEKTPWSETYWPRNQGSINIRWNAPGKPGFDYRSPSRQEVFSMSKEQLAQLSPAEKYDLAMGDYRYTITREVDRVRAKKNAKDWEGLCDGWTGMALLLKEPNPVEITNPDGVVIPFGSSDVKGLLSYYGATYADFGNLQVGSFCGTLGAAFGTANCQDINAGAYHVILANQIGLKQEGFAAEIDPKREVWNQPVFGFEFEVVGSANSSAPRALRIHAKMHYTNELEVSNWNPVLGTNEFRAGVQEVDYILELDQQDRIIGGKWLKRSNHPDTFWLPTRTVRFEGKMAGLEKLVSDNL